MATQLAPHVYHERQEQGSMLCAQHAINALVQHRAMDAGQLASIASVLDEQEQAELGSDTVAAARAADPRTANMDDTGFFSIAVIETALQAWGLHLERFAAPAMAHVRTEPQLQLAFLLNLESHWFTYRSFGSEHAYWFNLNSFLPSPQPVGALYLSELLRASEAEHYTVFVVVADSTAAAQAFHNTDADQVADLLPHPFGPGAGGGQQRTVDLTGSDQEDADLQAAIRASLAQDDDSVPPPASAPVREASLAPPAVTPARGGPNQPLSPPTRAQRRRQRRRNLTQSSVDPEENLDANAPPTSRPIAMGGHRRSSRGNSARQAISLSSSDASTSFGGGASLSRSARRGNGFEGPQSMEVDQDDEDDRLADMLSSSANSPFAHPAVRGTVQGGQSDSDVESMDIRSTAPHGPSVPLGSTPGTRSNPGSTSSRRHRRRQERAELERDMQEDHHAALADAHAGYDDVYLDEEDEEPDDTFADLQRAMWERAATQFGALDRSQRELEPDLEPEAERSLAQQASFTSQDRTYDDEDAALQAALAASMGDTSALERLQTDPSHAQLVSQQERFSNSTSTTGSGTEIPATAGAPQPPDAAPADVQRIAQMRAEAAAAAQREASGQPSESEASSQAKDLRDGPSASEASEAEDEEDVSPDEMRRRRLARFG